MLAHDASLLLEHRVHGLADRGFVVRDQNPAAREDRISIALAHELVGAEDAARSGSGVLEEFLDSGGVRPDSLRDRRKRGVAAREQRACVLRNLLDRDG